MRGDFARWSVLPIRLIVGGGFIQHGYAKLSRGPDAFASVLDHLGFPLPHFASWLTIGTEIFGGIAVLFGAFVLWASAPMAFVLLAAMVRVHLPYGFSSVKLVAVSASGAKFGPVGYEVDLLYLAGLAMLVLHGSGPFSVAGAWQQLRKRRGRAMGNAPLQGGSTTAET